MVYDTYRPSIGYKYRDLCRKWGGAGLAATVLVLECFFCLHGAIWRDNLYIYMPLDIATLMG